MWSDLNKCWESNNLPNVWVSSHSAVITSGLPPRRRLRSGGSAEGNQSWGDDPATPSGTLWLEEEKLDFPASAPTKDVLSHLCLRIIRFRGGVVAAGRWEQQNNTWGSSFQLPGHTNYPPRRWRKLPAPQSGTGLAGTTQGGRRSSASVHRQSGRNDETPRFSTRGVSWGGGVSAGHTEEKPWTPDWTPQEVLPVRDHQTVRLLPLNGSWTFSLPHLFIFILSF